MSKNDDITITASKEDDPDFLEGQKLQIKTIHIVKITVGEVVITLSREQAKELQKILAAILL
jgi:hypothetical protein